MKQINSDANLENLLKENSILNLALDAIHDAIYIVDKTSHILYINKACERIDHLNRHDTIGKSEYDVYGCTEFFDIVVLDIFKTGKQVLNEVFTYKRLDGKIQKFFYSAYPLYQGKEIIAVMAIWWDTKLVHTLITETYELQQKLLSDDTPHKKSRTSYYLNDIVTKDPIMETNIEVAFISAKSDVTVMIYGETGSGKELFAQGIHNASLRQRNPFIAVNCSAIPENLLESTLFGTVKGAFTDAMDLPGLFEQAKEGTIFLDEINSLPLHLQPKLLRVLQEKMVRRIGSKFETEINCRVICATNTDPFKALEKGSLRPDLFFRLSTRIIYIPPLRERIDDIDLLIEYYLRFYNQKYHRNITGITEDVLQLFYSYSWPGNIRELQNILEGGISLTSIDDSMLNVSHIPSYIRKIIEKKDPQKTKQSINKEINYEDLQKKIFNEEAEAISNALYRNRNNITKAAQSMGISRQTLLYRMKKYGISKDNK